MYILSYYTGHTATAALLKDGQIIACASEERFTNVKNYLGFPAQSIEWCLTFAGITGKDLGLVVRCGKYSAPTHTANKQDATLSLLAVVYGVVGIFRSFWRRLVYYLPFLRPISRFFYVLMTRTLGAFTVAKERRFVADHLGVPANKIVCYEHHLLHAASAYYASPYNQEKALVLTLDAEGDHLSATVNTFQKRKWLRLASTYRASSLGWLFLYVTQYLGMKPMEHEFKVMGLAPYAKPEHVNKLYEKIKSVVTLDPNNPLIFRSTLSTYDSLFWLEKKLKGARFDNIAGAFQKLLEERMVEWTSAAIAKTQLSTVIFSGGAFMNVKANQKLLKIPGLKQAFFMPSAGDESLPIGGCYLGYLELTKDKPSAAPIKPITDLYWGMEYTDDQIKQFIQDKKVAKKYQVKRFDSIEDEIARLLSEGKIVARLHGRMEWGARALGNRSIIANPQFPDAIRVINEQMKNRDFWMPFAPSVLDVRLKDYCIVPKNVVSPYMTISYDTTDLGKKELKAAMHPYDFTVRAQAVIEEWNPSYYKLIRAFEKKTGIGAVLNTSFNLHGYPIVKGPAEAYYAFENSGLDYLALENYLISKS